MNLIAGRMFIYDKHDKVWFLTIVFSRLSGKVCFKWQHTIVPMVLGRFHAARDCCGLISVEIQYRKEGEWRGELINLRQPASEAF